MVIVIFFKLYNIYNGDDGVMGYALNTTEYARENNVFVRYTLKNKHMQITFNKKSLLSI